ncbi:MAG: tRNA lysidine(34) synthetase TilS [Mycobacteriales bacterium]
MPGPPPAVAQVRIAVRAALSPLAADSLVLAAVSGGADSLALLAATAFEAPRRRLRIGLITVDHGLQAGSAERAAELARWARSRGIDPAEAIAVDVGTSGGPEGAARAARYDALTAAADRHHAAAILLGHTREDQAETVLLALARGSGARALSGMRARRGRFLRPLLSVRRDVVRAAAAVDPFLAGRVPWADPHNEDQAYARVRVRAATAELAELLGPGLVAGLARSSDLLRADADHLDALAAAAAAENGVPDRLADGLDTAALGALAPAVRTRVLRLAALAAGAPGGALSSAHVDALDALVSRWHGQGPVSLPRGVRAERRHGRLSVFRSGDDLGGRQCTTATSKPS